MRIKPEANSNDSVEVVKLNISCDLTVTFFLNNQEIPDSCRFVYLI